MEEKELNVNEPATEETKNEKVNVSKLTEKQAKKMLKEVLAVNEELVNSLKTVTEEANKYKDSWYRSAADFENFKKRNQETRINAYKEGKIDAITGLLRIGDSLDRALTMNLDDKTREGITLTARSFSEILESLGVTAINPVDEDFDPLTQEAIMQVPAEEGETAGKVKQVFLKGYKLGDKVIRYAQVVVIG
ncbi:MAG: nucleotide exchange factor GrpE [Clostridia bacterium]|nr:nucleotide exchange factor GrpE [Clostridia bacterium]